MNVLAVNKTNFNVSQLVGVTNIAYDSVTDRYTIAYSGGTTILPASAWYLTILLY